MICMIRFVLNKPKFVNITKEKSVSIKNMLLNMKNITSGIDKFE